MLRYLAELGLTPGKSVKVLDIAPFDGPFTLEIDGQEKIIGSVVASAIQVTS
jgi:DtxR family Mn-dependent transcriptional regulator